MTSPSKTALLLLIGCCLFLGQVQSRPAKCSCYHFLDVQCGTDGRTYLNKCVLACAKPYTGATLEHPGYCEETTNEYDVVGENFDPERIGWGK